MFYNSIKENMLPTGGKKGGGNKGGGKYERAVWINKESCLNQLKEKEPKCKYKDKSSDKWVDCDPENKNHNAKVKEHKKMLERWRRSWCGGMESVDRIKNKYDPGTLDWMKGQYKNYKAEMKKQYAEDLPMYNVETGQGNAQALVGYSPHLKIYNMSLEFK